MMTYTVRSLASLLDQHGLNSVVYSSLILGGLGSSAPKVHLQRNSRLSAACPRVRLRDPGLPTRLDDLFHEGLLALAHAGHNAPEGSLVYRRHLQEPGTGLPINITLGALAGSARQKGWHDECHCNGDVVLGHRRYVLRQRQRDEAPSTLWILWLCVADERKQPRQQVAGYRLVRGSG